MRARSSHLRTPKTYLCFRFDIVKKLGQGTYGKVQLAINKETGQDVSITIYLPVPRMHRRFKRSQVGNDRDESHPKTPARPEGHAMAL